MLIIGHRGAAGLAPENTIASIKAGVESGADMIEFDIRVTKDKKIIVIHDPNLFRTTGTNRLVGRTSLKEISKIRTKEDKTIPTLEEAVETCGNIPVIVDAKGSNWAKPLADMLKSKKIKIGVISKNHQELAKFISLCPHAESYVSVVTNPFEVIQVAKRIKASGICLNFSLYNPFIYFFAKRGEFSMIGWTINSPRLAWIFHFLYPEVKIFTDYPDRFHKREKI